MKGEDRDALEESLLKTLVKQVSFLCMEYVSLHKRRRTTLGVAFMFYNDPVRLEIFQLALSFISKAGSGNDVIGLPHAIMKKLHIFLRLRS